MEGIKIEEEVEFINVKDIEIRKGEKGHAFKCVAIFNNGNEWVIKMPILEKLCEGIGICEDKKYPNGLGRNMFFLAHLIHSYKGYLEKNKIKLPEEDYEFSQKFRIENEIKIRDLTLEKKEAEKDGKSTS